MNAILQKNYHYTYLEESSLTIIDIFDLKNRHFREYNRGHCRKTKVHYKINWTLLVLKNWLLVGITGESIGIILAYWNKNKRYGDEDTETFLETNRKGGDGGSKPHGIKIKDTAEEIP